MYTRAFGTRTCKYTRVFGILLIFFHETFILLTEYSSIDFSSFYSLINKNFYRVKENVIFHESHLNSLKPLQDAQYTMKVI